MSRLRYLNRQIQFVFNSHVNLFMANHFRTLLVLSLNDLLFPFQDPFKSVELTPGWITARKQCGLPV